MSTGELVADKPPSGRANDIPPDYINRHREREEAREARLDRRSAQPLTVSFTSAMEDARQLKSRSWQLPRKDRFVEFWDVKIHRYVSDSLEFYQFVRLWRLNLLMFQREEATRPAYYWTKEEVLPEIARLEEAERRAKEWRDQIARRSKRGW